MQQQKPQKHLKTLLCQLKPILKQKTQNIKRMEQSLANYSDKDKIDVILFPEMSFIGYNFQFHEDALPYAVKAGEGQQFQFCKKLAIRTKAYVLYGYIQKQQKDNKTILYNSAVVLDRQGNMILNYRKTFLYFCDSLWCSAGDGFKSLTIKNVKGQQFKCALCICMDINPKDFTSGEYQFGEFMVKENVEVVLFLTNWVDSQAQTIEDSAVLAMYNYWASRMTPALSTKKQAKKPFLFLAADRVGSQYSYFDKKDTIFFGSSCSIMFNPNYLVQKLGKKDEGYLLVENKLPK